MAKYTVCPSCGHNPHGMFSSYMYIYKCETCGKLFCHKCSGSNGGKKCPKCGSQEVKKDGECS